MILWFLRLFPQFRALELDLASAREALQQESEERVRAEYRLDELIKDRDRDRQMLQDALQGERYALQSQANILSQRTGAGAPYPDAHKIEATHLTQEGGPAGASPRLLPSQRAEMARAAGITKIVQEQIRPMFE